MKPRAFAIIVATILLISSSTSAFTWTNITGRWKDPHKNLWLFSQNGTQISTTQGRFDLHGTFKQGFGSRFYINTENTFIIRGCHTFIRTEMTGVKNYSSLKMNKCTSKISYLQECSSNKSYEIDCSGTWIEKKK